MDLGPPCAIGSGTLHCGHAGDGYGAGPREHGVRAIRRRIPKHHRRGSGADKPTGIPRYGNALFPGGPGNTFGNAEAFAQIMDSLEHHIFDALPDETWIYPGHGDDSTIGAERPCLRDWRTRGW